MKKSEANSEILKLIRQHKPEHDNIKFYRNELEWLRSEIGFDDSATEKENLIAILRSGDTGLDKSIAFISENLGKRTENELVAIINFSNRLKNKFWHLEALAIAELAARVPKNKGGRGHTVKNESGREKFFESLGKKFKIGTTKARQSVQIVEIFGIITESALDEETPTSGVGVSGGNKFYFDEPKKDGAGEEYLDTAVSIDAKKNIRRSFKFDPQGLTIGFYKTAMRFEKDPVRAKQLIQEAVKKRKKNPDFSSADFERFIINDLEDYKQSSKIKKNSRRDTFSLELNLSEKEAKILDKLIELELGFSMLKPSDEQNENEEKLKKEISKILIDAIQLRINYIEKKGD